MGISGSNRFHFTGRWRGSGHDGDIVINASSHLEALDAAKRLGFEPAVTRPSPHCKVDRNRGAMYRPTPPASLNHRATRRGATLASESPASERSIRRGTA